MERDEASGEVSAEAKQLQAEIFEGRLYTAKSVAYILNLDTSSILRMVRNGELAALKIGRQYQIPDSEVRAYTKRAQDEEIGKVRLARIRREVVAKAAVLRKDSGVARRVGITLCTNCTCDVLVHLHNRAWDGYARGRPPG
jgi:excisionase family DNA binding protein